MSPRTKRQNLEIREASMDKIFEAALELFGTHGYHATSINDIVKKAGVSKGLVYHYFKSKEELLEQLVNSLVSEGHQSIQNIMDSDPKVFLKNMFEVLFDEIQLNFNKWRLIMNVTFQIDQMDFVRKISNEKYKGYIELFTGFFNQMNIKDPQAEARIVAAILDGLALQYLVLRESMPMDEIKNSLIKKYC